MRSGMTMREAKIVLKSKGVNDPYMNQSYSQVARENIVDPRNSPQRYTKETKSNTPDNQEKAFYSPTSNRFSSLSNISGFWEDPMPSLGDHMPSNIAGKRVRDSPSPKQKRSLPKKTSRMQEGKTKSPTRSEEITPMEGKRIESLATATHSRWEDMEMSGELSDTQEEKEGEDRARENDMTGVREEIRRYKEDIEKKEKHDEKEETKGNTHLPQKEQPTPIKSQHLKGCRCNECNTKMEQRLHTDACSCERCMYRAVRELKYRTDRNISEVIDDFMYKLPEKDLSKHPRDCLCGAHLKQKIKVKRIPYSKIVQQIVDNKYRP